jgi:hypothetical protein
MKWLTRDGVLPIVSARVAWLMFGLIGCGLLPCLNSRAIEAAPKAPLGGFALLEYVLVLPEFKNGLPGPDFRKERLRIEPVPNIRPARRPLLRRHAPEAVIERFADLADG